MERRALAGTGLSVTPLCIGASPLGSSPQLYGYSVEADQAVATVLKVLDGPINFLDTSNNYGAGESERRIGAALTQAGGVPAGFVLATKVDPAPGSDDFSGDRVRVSVAESLERLGLDRLQLVYLHDPERISFAEATAAGGPLEALVGLRDEGVIEHLGVAGAPVDVMQQYLATEAFEAVISHNRFTLVDQSATPLIQDAERRGVAFVNAAPYGGGLLVKGPDEVRTYCYQPASSATLERVRTMAAACASRGVPLAAAALQFSLRDLRVTSTIVGVSAPERIEQTIRLAEWPIDDDLWAELGRLAAPGRDGVF